MELGSGLGRAARATSLSPREQPSPQAVARRRRLLAGSRSRRRRRPAVRRAAGAPGDVPRRDQPVSQALRASAELAASEVEKIRGQRLAVRTSGALVTQVVKAVVSTRLQRANARLGIVLKESSEEGDQFRTDVLSKDGAPTGCFDGGEREVEVLRIHRQDLPPRRGAKDLDDLYKLVHSVLTREEGSASEHLREDAPERPEVDRSGVIRRPKDKLGRSVVAGADVGNQGRPALAEAGG
mmetsp:Transcript_110587/g.276985  ORF Transcript_110587/g.276985 Transcript_110587/m.276985 type:complete len:239 (-) Transcript_110587:721-1437(-)